MKIFEVGDQVVLSDEAVKRARTMPTWGTKWHDALVRMIAEPASVIRTDGTTCTLNILDISNGEHLRIHRNYIIKYIPESLPTEIEEMLQ